jgi:hypothetical protein
MRKTLGSVPPVAACLVAALWGSGVMSAEPAKLDGAKFDGIVGEQVKAEETARASQQRIEDLDAQTTRMLADYRQTIAEVDSLKNYNDHLAVQVQSQDGELATMTRQLEEIATTAREVLPMMNKMLATLEQFVQLDMPFLSTERANRIDGLKDMAGRADVSISEKYRRIVEAYQIEIEYGRTLEAYEGQVDGKTVQFLRAGRVSLLYQTLDGRETAYWDVNEKVWKTDARFREALTEGLKIAKKQAAPDFVGVALPAPVEIGS